MSVHITADHIRRAERIVEKARRNSGLAPLDIEKFWHDQEIARKAPWAPTCPQVPLGIMMSRECFFAELDVKEDWYRLTHDSDYVASLTKPYNDKAEEIVGRRLLSENRNAVKWPEIKSLADIFEARNVWHDMSYWLQQSAKTEEELSSLLDRVEKRLEDLRSFLLPAGWDKAKADLVAAGAKVPLYRSQRGPVTFAMSIYGLENVIYLIMDNPDLAARFRDTILHAMLERARILDEEAGFTPETAPHGFGWADDNCAMLNAEMYNFFGAPILKGVFDRYSPDPGDRRDQHSDSDMAHHLPTLGKLGLNGTNFGPNLKAREIRQHLPNALIRGQLAPFTFSRNEEVNMIAELIRDIEMTRETKGLLFMTAGSINNGSRLTSMRLIMAAIQEFKWLD